MNNLKLFQTYYNDFGLKQIDQDIFIPYNVSHNMGNPFLEYTIFKEIVTNNSSIDFIGILSWKFEAKTQIKSIDFFNFCLQSIGSDYDLIFINPMIASESIYLNVWEQGILSHPPMSDLIMNLIQSNIDINIMSKHDSNSFVLCNYFVANQITWQKYFDYVDNILLIIKDLSKCNKNVARLWDQPAGYGRNKSLSIKPFFIERLLSNFINTQNIASVAYKYTLEQYISRFGIISGTRLHKLSFEKLALNTSLKMDMDKWKLQQTNIHNCPLIGTLGMEDLSDLILFNN